MTFKAKSTPYSQFSFFHNMMGFIFALIFGVSIFTDKIIVKLMFMFMLNLIILLCTNMTVQSFPAQVLQGLKDDDLNSHSARHILA